MIKSIKLIAIVLILIVFVISCMPESDPVKERTPEMEQAEIDVALKKIEADGFNVDTTELGIFYIEHVPGEGPTALEGDTCYLKYVGYFLDGTVFDASAHHYEDEIWEFIYKDVELIPGLDNALALSSKGSEIDCIIPSEHAYGATGTLRIPPYKPLLFSTIMVDLKPVNTGN